MSGLREAGDGGYELPAPLAMAPAGVLEHIAPSLSRGGRLHRSGIGGMRPADGWSAMDDVSTSGNGSADWGEEVFRALRRYGIRLVATVPDGGLGRFLQLCEEDPGVRLITLTTEEEGIALVCGSWLGGELGVVAMQSSGVGNVVNMLGLPNVCRIPCLLLVTMRGEAEERNPWQVPMGEGTPGVLSSKHCLLSRSLRRSRPERF